ncbi:MAG: uracil-DNA glycosylase [Bacillota bacterium]
MLFLLESPGPQTASSGFISRNNPNPTARNLWRLFVKAKVPRPDTVLWNIVPWYLGAAKGILPAKSGDIAAGLEHLPELFSLLPRLREIVLIGLKAQRIEGWLAQDTRFRLSKTFHPSGKVIFPWLEKRHHILQTFQDVASRLGTKSTGRRGN